MYQVKFSYFSTKTYVEGTHKKLRQYASNKYPQKVFVEIQESIIMFWAKLIPLSGAMRHV